MTEDLRAVRCPRHPCQDFAASVPATRGLIAAPWTPLAFLCSGVANALALSPTPSRSQRPGHVRHRRQPPWWGSAEPVRAQGDCP
jgi:hypothetical protein